MDEKIIMDNDLARVLDLLEQIKKLNKMIAMHQDQSGDAFMVSQYQDMKNRFLVELKALLSDYEIEVIIKSKAA